MSDSYEINPKIPIATYGTMYRSKVDLNCTLCPEVDFDEDLHKDKDLVIPAGSVLFYVEDSQFYSASKIFRTPMSAWIRLHFLTGDKRSLWTTLVCSQQRVWDFEPYRRRKRMIAEALEESLELLEFEE